MPEETTPGRRAGRILHAACFTAVSGVLAAGPMLSGCATRSEKGAYAADSTMTYASSRAADVNASITFELKGSRKAEAAREAEAARKAEIRRKTESAKSSEPAKRAPKKRKPARKDTLSVKSAEPAPKKTEKRARREERIFDLEEGARVQATVAIENRHARGARPLLLHTVWLKPDGKRTYKKMLTLDPTGPDSTVTTSFTIDPARRPAGTYTLQVFLFRELVAEKTFELRGEGLDVEEGRDGAM
jgi:hypothetical protein